MSDGKPDSIEQRLSEARQRIGHELSAQAEQMDKLAQALQELRERTNSLKETLEQQFDSLAASAAAPPPSELSVDKLLTSVRNLMTANLPEQVLALLTEEATQLGVRSAAFDVRGKAAWGAAAHGFGPQLDEKSLRALAVPLNQDTPFRLAYETGAHVDATPAMLKKNRNILDKLKPAAEDAILILPIRSAGSVSAILYADSGGKKPPLPVDALKLLGEFAGAQLDRLLAFSGGMQAEAQPAPVVEEPPALEAEKEREEQVVEVPEAAVEVAQAPEPAAPPPVEPPAPPPPVEVEVAPAQGPVPVAVAEAPKPAEIPQLSPEEEKAHKDAKRFAKLLVSEIELYNKAKVSEGRKNKDLYKRLKADIERSRQTYDKRFSKTIGVKPDYFSEEMIRTLANDDVTLMGSEYLPS